MPLQVEVLLQLLHLPHVVAKLADDEAGAGVELAMQLEVLRHLLRFG